MALVLARELIQHCRGAIHADQGGVQLLLQQQLPLGACDVYVLQRHAEWAKPGFIDRPGQQNSPDSC